MSVISVFNAVYSQLALKPAYPKTDCSSKTIIVPGANVGLDKETVKHFVRSNAEKLIAAVRSITRGEVAKAGVEAETRRPGAVEV